MDRGHPSRHERVASAGATLRWVLLRCDCESANSLGARHSPRLVRWNRGWPLKWWSLRRDRNCRNRWHLKNRKSVSWYCEAVDFQLCGMYRPNRSASSRDLLFQWLVGSVSSAFDATFEKVRCPCHPHIVPGLFGPGRQLLVFLLLRKGQVEKIKVSWKRHWRRRLALRSAKRGRWDWDFLAFEPNSQHVHRNKCHSCFRPHSAVQLCY